MLSLILVLFVDFILLKLVVLKLLSSHAVNIKVVADIVVSDVTWLLLVPLMLR